MVEVNLSQFNSLFEIGFALHFAVAFLDRIYSRELPVRIDKITARAKALERLRHEIVECQRLSIKTREKVLLHLTSGIIENPVWVPHNDQLLDKLYALKQDINGQIKVQKRILNVITFLSILVVFYSVVMLFMIGLEANAVMGLGAMTASVLVLMQLLPLPFAAGIFYFVARRMSHEADRKIRGMSERNLILNNADTSPTTSFTSVEHIYRRDLKNNGNLDGAVK